MINYGFNLKKLVVRGEGKKDAILTFDKGLNVVAGASDTGKSFAFECINYVLGARDIPSKPNEANGYDMVFLEIENNGNKQISTLQRSLNEMEKSKIYHIFSDIDNIRNGNTEILSSKHNAKNSISKLLLDLCNCKYENVLSSASKGKTRSFSFRDFVHLTMLNETKVVGKNSPVYTSDSKKDPSRTSEATAFHTLIRGNDYKKSNITENPEIARAKLRGQIEELYTLCDTLRQEISDSMQYTHGKNYDDVNYSINHLKAIVEEKKKIIAVEEKIYQTLKNECCALSEKKERIEENAKKFNLLKKNYNSDIERLEFIEEAHCYTDQLVSIKCPICHSSNEFYNDMVLADKSVYYIALEKEKKKLSMQLSDLQDTINDFYNDIIILDKEIESKQSEIAASEQRMTTELAPIVTKTLDELKHLFDIKEFFIKINNNRERLESLNKRINDLNDKISTPKTSGNVTEIEQLPMKLLEALCDNIQNLLSEWNFEKLNVKFDLYKNDVIVGDKEKSSFGKGARAVINTAFIIAAMQYCLNRNLPHPTFIIVDSPLTTYKEKDKKQGEINEEVIDNVKRSFFENLSKINNDCQIIIFDNVVPPKSVSNINYHHFTGNDDIDRTGFIPKN
ncbi:MAG: hypothetical protein ABFC84_04170 [Veillonellales bacterium]